MWAKRTWWGENVAKYRVSLDVDAVRRRLETSIRRFTTTPTERWAIMEAWWSQLPELLDAWESDVDEAQRMHFGR